jgi:two-component system NtrC family response regulator
LLIVDDDEDICTQMKWSLNQDYDLLLAHDSSTAVEMFKNSPTPTVLLDLGLPPNPADSSEGLRVLSELLTLDPHVKVIIITGQSEQSTALEAISRGAYDFLAKPIQMDVLKVILHRALYVAQLERECRKLQELALRDGFEGMLGSSPAILEAFSTIRKVASTNAPVLILGESGTGKEMAALAIHRNSSRKDGPFVPINCGAIPETLLESELFGHEKGAFTGAHLQRPGRIENAHRGTLFLDEISEITPPLQVKLLRFLQEQRIERIGGRKEIQIDTRVIAATNADLTKTMQSGTFREDLYYRLAVVTLKLPPLRDRQGDVPLLAQAFLHRFAKEFGKGTVKLASDGLRALQQHIWPGNVRELENRVKRAVIMAEGSYVTSADLELNAPSGARTAHTLQEAREAVEREMVEQALRRHNGKVSAAAAGLGISRPTLYELMEKLGIRKKKDAEAAAAQE